MKIGIMLMLGIVAINSVFYYSSETIKKDDADIGSQILNDFQESQDKIDFNSEFYKYKGIQEGDAVNSLLDEYYELEDNLPLIVYISKDDEQIELIQDKEYIESMKEVIEDSHKYYIYMETNEKTGLIHGIVISYNISHNKDEEYHELAKEIANE